VRGGVTAGAVSIEGGAGGKLGFKMEEAGAVVFSGEREGLVSVTGGLTRLERRG